ELVPYEGNYANRGAAARWDLSDPGPKGFGRMCVIGRFAEGDFNKEPEVKPDAESPDPEVEGARLITGRHEDIPGGGGAPAAGKKQKEKEKPAGKKEEKSEAPPAAGPAPAKSTGDWLAHKGGTVPAAILEQIKAARAKMPAV